MFSRDQLKRAATLTEEDFVQLGRCRRTLVNTGGYSTCSGLCAQPRLYHIPVAAHLYVAQIHPRMPVILAERHHATWLGETDDGNLKELLVPYPADQMRMWEISPRVNSLKNDDPSLWEPIHAEPADTDTTINTLELLRE
jgi:hypothetical protein